MKNEDTVIFDDKTGALYVPETRIIKTTRKARLTLAEKTLNNQVHPRSCDAFLDVRDEVLNAMCEIAWQAWKAGCACYAMDDNDMDVTRSSFNEWYGRKNT